MKKLPSLLALLPLLLLLVSCGNLNNRLPKQEGTWSLESEHRLEIINDNVVNDSTSVDLGSLIFRKDGTGSKWFSDDTTSFEWTYSTATEQITIVQQSVNFVYNVLENKKDRQTWQNIAEVSSQGTTARVETTWELKRE